MVGVYGLHDSIAANTCSAGAIKNHFIKLAIAKLATEWRDFVKTELWKGGGSLFKFISKLDTEFLNVDYTTGGGTDNNPSVFLKKQSEIFEPLWNPEPHSNEHATVATHIAALRQLALEEPEPEPTPEQYKKALHNYKKDTKGGDNWTATELEGLPDIAISELNDNLILARSRAALPHQSLLSLNHV